MSLTIDGPGVKPSGSAESGGFEWQRKFNDGSWELLNDECDETITLNCTEAAGKYRYRARPYGSDSSDDWHESTDRDCNFNITPLL